MILNPIPVKISSSGETTSAPAGAVLINLFGTLPPAPTPELISILTPLDLDETTMYDITVKINEIISALQSK